jgi:hypothetical protein
MVGNFSERNEIRGQTLRSAIPRLKKVADFIQDMSCDVQFSGHTSPSNAASNETSNCDRLVVTSGLRPFPGRRQSVEHVGIDRCDSNSKSCHEVFDGPGRGCINLLLQVCSQEKSRSELEPATEEATQSVLHAQSPFPTVRWSCVVLKPQPHS